MKYLFKYNIFEKLGYNELFDDIMTNLIKNIIKSYINDPKGYLEKLFNLSYENVIKAQSVNNCYYVIINVNKEELKNIEQDIKKHLENIDYDLEGITIVIYRKKTDRLNSSIDINNLKHPIYHLETNSKTLDEFINELNSNWGNLCISHENGHLYHFIMSGKSKIIPILNKNGVYESISRFAIDFYKLLPNDYPNKYIYMQSIYWCDFREISANTFISGKLKDKLKGDDIEINPLILMRKISNMAKYEFCEYLKEDIPKLLNSFEKENYLFKLDILINKYFGSFNKFYIIVNKMSKKSYRKMLKNL